MKILIDTDNNTINLLDKINKEDENYYRDKLHYFFIKKQYEGLRIIFNFLELTNIEKKDK
jgi:hypothetical protein